ncbi:MAG TPA: glutathione S-transferase family protein [Devosia sp.]|nr:glutathione S-transferase family protein [Devosia sp.]
MYVVVGLVGTRLTRVTWMLEELGQPYDILNVRPRSEVMNSYNPSGKVPALIDKHGKRDLVVVDSAAICTYLADRHPEKNMSAEPGSAERAQIDSFLHFAQSELEAPLWCKAKHRFILPKELRIWEIGAACAYEFDLAVASLEKRLENREFAVGERMTAADVLLGHTGMWAKKARFEVKSAPVRDYFSRMLARPALARASAREDEFSDRGGI